MAAIAHHWAGDADKSAQWAKEISDRGSDLTGEIFLKSFPFRGELLARVTGALQTIGL